MDCLEFRSCMWCSQGLVNSLRCMPFRVYMLNGGGRAKEFKDVPSTRQQIVLVKRMLAELGMNGRLSLNQAKQIKEQRELMKDLGLFFFF